MSSRKNSGIPSDYVIVFDCETTVDASQNLRIGTYLLMNGAQEEARGIFYNPKKLKPGEKRTLFVHAKKLGIPVITAETFVDDVFYQYGYERRATIVGFNLAFDISRLAIKHAKLENGTPRMIGGFTLKLSEREDFPNVHIKHISSKLSFFEFADKPGDAVKRYFGEDVTTLKGFFLDVKTLAVALTAIPHTLKTLAEALDTRRKSQVDNHGGTLKPEYIDYAINDTLVTWECYQKLLEMYGRHGLKKPPHKVYSEAGLGKAYLEEMNIQPHEQQKDEESLSITGHIMSSYYGGRTEVRIRREIVQVQYCDFLSMYPSVCTLMGLWKFVIAQGMEWQDSTQETQQFLNHITLAQLRDPKTWPLLRRLVQVKPDKDIFPVRAKYGGEKEPPTIGVNYLSSEQPLWYTVSDCIVSTLLTGKAPQVVKAWTFTPLPPQEKLQTLSPGVIPEAINPREVDFFARIIDLRNQIKRREKGASGSKRAEFHSQQKALKILANATSYGIFMELNDQKSSKKDELWWYSYGDKPQPGYRTKHEEPGHYFHPLLGTLITGAARLMLALAERLTQDEGLDWAFCDTDSMAIARPEGMTEKEFYARAGKIREWFSPLNPYADKEEQLFKCEDENYGEDSNPKALYCFAVSAKRYALFNKLPGNKIDLRKVSAHGLGHLRDPYNNNKVSLAEGENPLEEVGDGDSVELSKVKPWHRDFWECIVQAALNGREKPDYSVIKELGKHAASMFSASTPEREAWFREYNKDRAYDDRVRPFNFLLIFKEKSLAHLLAQIDGDEEQQAALAIPRDKPGLFPVAPFDRDLAAAADNCFDRYTPKIKITKDMLATYAQDRRDYHLHSEAKFHNGHREQHGKTRRRHIRPTATIKLPAIVPIGKEANSLEEQVMLGADNDKLKQLVQPHHSRLSIEFIRQAKERHGLRPLAREAKMSPQELQNICDGKIKHIRKLTDENLNNAIQFLDRKKQEDKELLLYSREEVENERLTIDELRKRTGIHSSNIWKMLRGERRLNASLWDALIQYKLQHEKALNYAE